MKRLRENDGFHDESNKKIKIQKDNPKSYELEIINAVTENNIRLLQEIIRENGIDELTLSAITNKLGVGLLTIAISNMAGEATDFLLEKFSKINIDLTPEINKLIIDACINGKIDFIHLLLDVKVQVARDSLSHKVSTNQRSTAEEPKLPLDKNIYGILQIAAENDHINVVQLLLHHTYKYYKVDENFKEVMLSFLASENLHNSSFNGEIQHTELTPLHIAVECGFTDIVKTILDYNVNLNIVDNQSNTPLHIAVREEQIEIAKILLDKGANIEAEDGSSGTPVYLAIAFHKPKALKLLAEQGADINQFIYVDGEDAPIELAVNLGNVEAVKILLRNGCALQDREFDPRFYDYAEASDIIYPLFISEVVELLYQLQKLSDSKDVAFNTIIVEPSSQAIDFYYGSETLNMEKFGFCFNQDDINLAKERLENLMIQRGLKHCSEFSQNTHEIYKAKFQETGCQYIFGDDFINEIGKIIDLHFSKYENLMSSLLAILTLEGHVDLDSKNVDHVIFFKALSQTEYVKDCGFSKLDYIFIKQPGLGKILNQLNNIILPTHLKSFIQSLRDYNSDSYKSELKTKVNSFEAELVTKDSQILNPEFSSLRHANDDDDVTDYNAILSGETSFPPEAN